MVQALSKCSLISLYMCFYCPDHVHILNLLPSLLTIRSLLLRQTFLYSLLEERLVLRFLSIITIVTRDGRTSLSLSCDHSITRKATRCNYHGGLPNVCFILKMSMFSEVSLESSQTYMMELFCKNS